MISTHKYPVADNYDSKSPYRRKKSTRFSDLLFNEGNVDQQVRARASDAEQFSTETSSAAQREGYFDAIHVTIGTSLPQTVVFSCFFIFSESTTFKTVFLSSDGRRV